MTILQLDQINLDEEIQSRVNLDFITIAEYASAMSAGDSFPPVTVFFDGSAYWLADGFHRIKAARQAGQTTITADVKPGDRRAAILYSVGANAAHGLRRSNEDKRRAVMTLLNDNEWSRWGDSEIARQTRTSHTYVGKLRSYLATFQDSPRLVRRGDSVYQMDTANIGKVQPFTEDEARQWENELEASLNSLKASTAKLAEGMRHTKSLLTNEQFTAWLNGVNITPQEAEALMMADPQDINVLLDAYFPIFERQYNINL